MSTCRYCKKWKNSTQRKKEDGYTRFCEAIKKDVNRDQEICSFDEGFFEMCESFWCEGFMHNKFTEVCVHKQNVNDEDCKFCSQGEDVMLSYDLCFEKLQRRLPKLVRRRIL